MSDFVLREARLDDFPLLSDLEKLSYPADEAASEAQMKLRADEAKEFFLVYENSQTHVVIGFINGTCINGHEIPKESMSAHIVGGQSLVRPS
jgi:hypothetical protein